MNQKAQRNMDEWEILAMDIRSRLESIQETVQDKQLGESLLGVMNKYSK
jgi:hypothetical protein